MYPKPIDIFVPKNVTIAFVNSIVPTIAFDVHVSYEDGLCTLQYRGGLVRRFPLCSIKEIKEVPIED